MKRPRKRTLLMVLLLLTGGTIINVAVAWGCWRYRGIATGTTAEARTFSVFTAKEMLQNRIENAGFIDAALLDARRSQGFGWRRSTILGSDLMLDTLETGFPSLALHGDISHRSQKPIGTIYPSHVLMGIAGPSSESATEHVGYWKATPTVWLPYLPLWPGFAINTIFYAAILWLLVAVLHPGGFMRRRIRARRGQCPGCAYPIGTSEVCTECGRQLR